MIQNPKPCSILCLCIILGAAVLPGGVAEAGLWGYRTLADPALGDSLGGNHSEVPPGWAMNRMDPAGRMGPAAPDPEISFDPTIGQIRES